MSAILSPINWVDPVNGGGAITTDDDVDAAPGTPGTVENLLTQSRYTRWTGPLEPVDNASNGANISLGQSREVGVIALLDIENVDPTVSGAFIIRAQNSNVDILGTATATAELEGDLGANHMVKVFDPPVNVSEIRIAWNTNTGSAETVSASRLWVGPTLDLSRYLAGFREVSDLAATKPISRGRNMFSRAGDARITKRTAVTLDNPEPDFLWGTAAEDYRYHTLEGGLRTAGRSGDVLFVGDTTTARNRRRTMTYGTIANDVVIAGARPKAVNIQIQEL